MARRFEYFQKSDSRTWLCIDRKVSRPGTWANTNIPATVHPYREYYQPTDILIAGWCEREGLCDYDPCFPGSVRPITSIAKKNIPQAVLDRIQFPKETHGRETE